MILTIYNKKRNKSILAIKLHKNLEFSYKIKIK